MLEVEVRNQGTATSAASSVVRIRFDVTLPSGVPGVVDRTSNIPSLAAGTSTTVTVPFPKLAEGDVYDPDANFMIDVDFNNDVAETDETNNSGTGLCLG